MTAGRRSRDDAGGADRSDEPSQAGDDERTQGGDGDCDDRPGADRGTYTLVVELAAPATVEVGALGDVDLAAGWYAYTGSAFGPGGFGRVDRHRELAAGERDVRHWHVDYLLGHPEATVDRAVRTPGSDVECAVSRRFVDGPPGEGSASGVGDSVADFGASDCDCGTHLVFAPDRGPLLAAVERAHDRSAGPGPTYRIVD